MEGDGKKGVGFIKDPSFLSTPSGWRATGQMLSFDKHMGDFYPRPPGGGRLADLEDERKDHPYFYPRPPGGGRLFHLQTVWAKLIFLSTPSGWRATYEVLCKLAAFLFLSTPSGWRATAKTDKVFICFCAKGRRICLFKTRKEKNLPMAF